MKIPLEGNLRCTYQPYTVGKRHTAAGELKTSLAMSRFGLILDGEINRTSGDGLRPLGDRILSEMMRMIRQQVNDHMLRNVICHSGDIRFSLSFPEGVHDSWKLPTVAPEKSLDDTVNTRGSVKDLIGIIEKASKTYGLDAGLIKAVIKTESDFDTTSTSTKGAMGLMQLMPETAGDLGVKNPYDPMENIMGGSRYLKMLLERYRGDTDTALAAYNWGMGNVERNPGTLPEETKTYITRVNKYYREMVS
jgi:hypothetical protein